MRMKFGAVSYKVRNASAFAICYSQISLWIGGTVRAIFFIACTLPHGGSSLKECRTNVQTMRKYVNWNVFWAFNVFAYNFSLCAAIIQENALQFFYCAIFRESHYFFFVSCENVHFSHIRFYILRRQNHIESTEATLKIHLNCVMLVGQWKKWIRPSSPR